MVLYYGRFNYPYWVDSSEEAATCLLDPVAKTHQPLPLKEGDVIGERIGIKFMTEAEEVEYNRPSPINFVSMPSKRNLWAERDAHLGMSPSSVRIWANKPVK